MSLFIDKNTTVFFDSFGVKYIPEEVLSKMKDKVIADNIFRIRDDDSIICGFYCIAFIGYILVGKMLLDDTKLFFRNDNKKNDKIICKYIRDKYVNP